MKKYVILLLVFSFLLLPIKGLAADSDIHIVVDGEKINTDTSPIISSNRVLVPIRVISEELGYMVQYDNEERKVTITDENTILVLKIDEPVIWKNNVKIETDTAPLIMNNRTLVPIRAVSENLNASVQWDENTRTVFINNNKVVQEDAIEGKYLSLVSYQDIGVQEPSRELISIEQNGTSITFNFDKNNVLIEKNITKLKNPNRLVIDFNNAVLSEDFSLPEIEENDLIAGIRYSQYQLDPNQVRVVIDLKQNVNYFAHVNKNSISFHLNPIKEKVVVIDAGHGGKDPGAIGVSGRFEKNLNLTIALKVAELLNDEPDLKVILTRDSDVYLSLDERVDFANKLNADLFLSIHANAMPTKPQITGTETYYTRSESYNFAKLVHRNLLEATGFDNRGLRIEDFRVIKYTTMPAALIEVGYVTNVNDEKAMHNPEFQQRVAEALAEAIKEYIKTY